MLLPLLSHYGAPFPSAVARLPDPTPTLNPTRQPQRLLIPRTRRGLKGSEKQTRECEKIHPLTAALKWKPNQIPVRSKLPSFPTNCRGSETSSPKNNSSPLPRHGKRNTREVSVMRPAPKTPSNLWRTEAGQGRRPGFGPIGDAEEGGRSIATKDGMKPPKKMENFVFFPARVEDASETHKGVI